MGHLSRWLKTDTQILIHRLGLISALFLAAFNAYDFTHHMIMEGGISWHAGIEGLVLLGLAFLLLAMRNTTHEEFRRAAMELSVARQELDEFRSRNSRLMKDYRDAVQIQFDRWGFTEGERTVAERLILGFTFREIAAQLDKKEKTVRNQSQSIYDKAGLTGRHDLAAFFLQDILDLERD
ncbi:MAG: response regulator transcription factor [Leptospiraceae bacterium]|nr:response regulator transcription factor [Leptospiraceae bacterium]MCB1305265.1 response regulator transcription factor [Leptospiraceae bacterium]